MGLKHGSLFSGIGGFDLAADWMGWENVFHCEWNEFGKKSLKYYWPKAISYDDIKKQISLFTEDELTYCREDSLANRIQSQENKKEKTMTDISGQKCLEQFERFDRVGLWAKTFAALLIGRGDWYSTRCKLTWKIKGTRSSRLYFQLAPSTLPTDGIESGLLLLKTPCAADSYSENLKKKEQKFGNSGTLAQEIQTGFIYERGLLPTPTAQASRSNPSQDRKKGNLSDKIAETYNLHGGKPSQINPRFVLEMMGFPPDWTESPFLNGETNQSKEQETR